MGDNGTLKYYYLKEPFGFDKPPEYPVLSSIYSVDLENIPSVCDSVPDNRDNEIKMLRERLKDAENVIEVLYAGCNETDQRRLFFEEYVTKWKGEK